MEEMFDTEEEAARWYDKMVGISKFKVLVTF